MMSKRCLRCAASKPTTEFNRNKCNNDGLDTYCRLCRRQINTQYYHNHPEAAANRQRSYLALRAPEEVLERRRANSRRWYAANPERVKYHAERRLKIINPQSP